MKQNLETKIKEKIINLLTMTDRLILEVSKYRQTTMESITLMREKYQKDKEKDLEAFRALRDAQQMEHLMTVQLNSSFDSLMEIWDIVKTTNLDLGLDAEDLQRLEKNVENNKPLFVMNEEKLVFSDKQTQAAIKTANEKLESEKPEFIEKFFENLSKMQPRPPKTNNEKGD